MTNFLKGISNFFHFKERSATFKKEIIGGITTFMAMAYILAVNPSMLSNAQVDPSHPIFTGNGYAGVFFLGTAISAFVSTMAMGLFAKIPVALAPGMGVNAFFTYTVAGTILQIPLSQALVCTFASGVLYSLVALTPLRLYIAKLLPRNMKLGIGAMIGLFLAYIGMCDAGIIVSGAQHFPMALKNSKQIYSMSTATKLGDFSDPFVIIALVTMCLVFVLHYMKVNGAAIIAMFSAIIMLAIAKFSGVTDANDAFKIQNYDSFTKFGHLSKEMWASFGNTFNNPKVYIAIFVFLYIDFFDTTGTLFSIGEQADLNKKDSKWLQKANIVDAGATIFGSTMLTSTVTSYSESSVGVSQGAKTGLASVITAFLFLITIAAWPLMSPFMPIHHIQTSGISNQIGTVMPVTGPILIMVGSLMISQLKHFDWKQTIDIPVLFVTLTFGMLGYSISTGIAAGIALYYMINFVALMTMLVKQRFGKEMKVNNDEFVMSKVKEKIKTQIPDLKKRVLNPVMIILFALAIAYFATLPLYAY